MDPIGRPNWLSRCSGSGVLAGMAGEEMSNVFSDEDLKRLKADLEHNYYPGEIERLQALSARLEAAEAVAYRLLDSTRQCSKGTADIIEAWERSKGARE